VSGQGNLCVQPDQLVSHVPSVFGRLADGIVGRFKSVGVSGQTWK
jgi:hypothetical protein